MVEKKFAPGEVIIQAGDYGDSFFQIVSGSVEVVAGEEQQKLTELKAEDFFGEMAVLEGYRRSATVRAIEDGAVVLEIPSSELSSFFEQKQGKILTLTEYLCNRLRALTNDYDDVTDLLEQLEKKPEKKEGLLERIRKSRAAASVMNEISKPSAETIRELETDHSKGFAKNVVEYPAGTIIFKEGESGDCMYDIHWGSVGIYLNYGSPEEEMLTRLYANRFFGEMAMIGEAPRSATAVVLEDNTTVEAIYPQDLEELFRKNPPKIGMIIRNLSHRLRELTNDYVAACRKVKELTEEE